MKLRNVEASLISERFWERHIRRIVVPYSLGPGSHSMPEPSLYVPIAPPSVFTSDLLNINTR